MEILVTGAAGYIGGLTVERLLADPAVKKVVCVDRAPQPAGLAHERIIWIQAELEEKSWEEKLPVRLSPMSIVHCAFKIRNPYGKEKETATSNLAACRNIFEFAFRRGVPKLVYLSSVAAYGASPRNVGKFLDEETPLRETKNPYGVQKRQSEEILQSILKNSPTTTKVYILRLNSVTGPRGQSLASKFGLITIMKNILPFIISGGPAWARQFVHEDDVVTIITTLATKNLPTLTKNPEVFNVAPEHFLTAKEIGMALHKITIRIPSWSVKPLFFLAWHLTLGRVPTRPESANGLIYPINVRGSRVTMIGFRYKYTAREAFLAKA